MEFSEAYRQRFIALDMEAYVMRFIDLLIPVLAPIDEAEDNEVISFR